MIKWARFQSVFMPALDDSFLSSVNSRYLSVFSQGLGQPMSEIGGRIVSYDWTGLYV